MFTYCICTQYLLGAPFALITASIRHGMEVISLWHCCHFVFSVSLCHFVLVYIESFISIQALFTSSLMSLSYQVLPADTGSQWTSVWEWESWGLDGWMVPQRCPLLNGATSSICCLQGSQERWRKREKKRTGGRTWPGHHQARPGQGRVWEQWWRESGRDTEWKKWRRWSAETNERMFPGDESVKGVRRRMEIQRRKTLSEGKSNTSSNNSNLCNQDWDEVVMVHVRADLLSIPVPGSVSVMPLVNRAHCGSTAAYLPCGGNLSALHSFLVGSLASAGSPRCGHPLLQPWSVRPGYAASTVSSLSSAALSETDYCKLGLTAHSDLGQQGALQDMSKGLGSLKRLKRLCLTALRLPGHLRLLLRYIHTHGIKQLCLSRPLIHSYYNYLTFFWGPDLLIYIFFKMQLMHSWINLFCKDFNAVNSWIQVTFLFSALYNIV